MTGRITFLKLKFHTFGFVLLLLVGSTSYQQEKGKSLPSISLKNENGTTISTGDFDNNGKPYVIALWAVWCPHCHVELNNISELYDDWVEESGFKLIAISIDDSKTSNSAIPYANSQGWDFEILLDKNGDLKRALGVGPLPYIAIVNANGSIVYERFNYYDGAEEELYEFYLKLIQ